MTSSSFRVAALALALGMAAGAHAQNVTTLNIDTRNTGVDLGLQHNPDGTISAKVPATSGTTSVAPGALGTAPEDLAPPGTSTLGNPTSAGRQNGNSGTNNGRVTPGVSGGTGIVNSGASGNGLDAATGNTGNATAGSAVDAQTAAQAAASSRSVSGTITGARVQNGVPGPALSNGRGMGNLSNGASTTGNGAGAAGSGGTSGGAGGGSR